ncbi:MAG: helix-hairpin-helix domain-containing protein, partial [Nanoarchaeota archaeon]
LRIKLPRGLTDLLDVMGLGPKKAMFLYKKLKIKDIADLEKAIVQKKLRKLPGFGQKTEENIVRGIEMFKKGKERMLLGNALLLANELVVKLKKLKEVHNISLAGSLRRMKETIGDIDILVTTSNAKKVMDFLTILSEVERVLAKGETKSTVILKGGIQADLRVLKDDEYGAALQYFTGSKEHNIKLRELAIKKGFKLSEYGLFRGKKELRVKVRKKFTKG